MAQIMAANLEATVSVNIPLNSSGNIAQADETAASQKSFSMNFFNGQALLSDLDTSPQALYTSLDAFCQTFWETIFNTSYDNYSIKAKVELGVTDS